MLGINQIVSVKFAEPVEEQKKMNRHFREILKENSVAQNILLNLGIPQIAPCTYFPFSDKQ